MVNKGRAGDSKRGIKITTVGCYLSVKVKEKMIREWKYSDFTRELSQIYVYEQCNYVLTCRKIKYSKFCLHPRNNLVLLRNYFALHFLWENSYSYLHIITSCLSSRRSQHGVTWMLYSRLVQIIPSACSCSVGIFSESVTNLCCKLESVAYAPHHLHYAFITITIISLKNHV